MPNSSLPTAAAAPLAGWGLVPSILRRVQSPVFPAREVSILEFDATVGGEAGSALRRAIDACAAAGGGRVVVPAGEFFTGPIRLRSNVDLHLQEGAVLRFSTRAADYLPAMLTQWEGVECYNYAPLVSAFRAENVAITGSGTLDGQASAEAWWPWKGPWEGATPTGWREGRPDQRAAVECLSVQSEMDVPIENRRFGDGDFLRPNFVQFHTCSNVLIEGVTVRNAPMWVLHPLRCRNVTIRGITVISHGPNNDGCNPESCTDVLIEDCLFDTGDDCIAIKAGRDRDGRRVGLPCENIVIRRCVMREGHGGVVVGSEVSGGVRRVFAEQCRMDSPRLERALRLKANSRRGGAIEDIYLRDIEVGRVAGAAISIDLTYAGERGAHPTRIAGVHVQRLRCESCEHALWIEGLPEQPVSGVQVEDCVFRTVERPNHVRHVLELAIERVDGAERMRG